MRLVTYLALAFLIILVASYAYKQYDDDAKTTQPAIVQQQQSAPPVRVAPSNTAIANQTAPLSNTPSIANTPDAGEAGATGLIGLIPEDSFKQPLIAQGLDAYNKGDYHKAIGIFTEAAKTDWHAYTGLGIAHFRLGNYKDSTMHLEYVLAKSASEGASKSGDIEFLAHKALSYAYYRLDNFKKTNEHAASALSMRRDGELEYFMSRIKTEEKTMVNSVEEETLHFKVVFDGYKHGGISRFVLDILEDGYGKVGREIDYYPDNPITVVLYTEKEFFDVTQAPMWAGGVYDGKIRLPVKGIEKMDKDFVRVVLHHEYVHALVQSLAQNQRVPLWFNEGLAETLVQRGFDRVGQVFPLRNLEYGFPSGSNRAVMIAYMESYSAVMYLKEKYGMYYIKGLLQRLGKGESFADAFQSEFYITYEEFLSTWGVKKG